MTAAARNEDSLYVYLHDTTLEELHDQLNKLEHRKPRSLIVGAGGFEAGKLGYYKNFPELVKAFSDYTVVAMIESSEVPLTGEQAKEAAFDVQKKSWIPEDLTLDCEPFFVRNKINNVDFTMIFMQTIGRPISAYVNPGHLYSLDRHDPTLLNSFLQAVKEGRHTLLLPVYSYAADCVNEKNIDEAVKILKANKVPFQVILDTKQPNALEKRVEFLTKLEVDMKAVTIYSLENNSKNVKAFGPIEMQKSNFLASMEIIRP